MNNEKIRVLLIEDNPGDARLVREMFADAPGPSFFLSHAALLAEGLERLGEGGFDVILLDLSLPDSQGPDTFEKVRARTALPVVLLTGLEDEGLASRLLGTGAQDYLVKGKADAELLGRSVRYAIERHRVEVELHRSEQRYRTIADNITDTVWLTDMNMRFTWVSPSVWRLRGFTMEELNEMPIEENLTAESASVMSKALAETLTPGNLADRDRQLSVDLELEFYKKDGSTFWGDVEMKLLRDAEGNPSGFLGTGHDITERKQADEALLRANVELKGYAHTVSHDLRGPIATVATTADLLAIILEGEGKKDGVPVSLAEATELLARILDREEGEAPVDNAGELLRLMKKGVGQAFMLINNLLALAEAGQAPAISEPVDISETVRSILEEKGALVEERGVHVRVDDDLGVAAMDPTHAYQLFANLTGNAIKYNDGPGARVEVRLLPAEGPGILRYLMRDNGPGVPEGLLETLFTPFIKGEGGGTGIGLSIVDKVVRLYGGSVRVFNDGGACFEFTLPDYSSQAGSSVAPPPNNIQP